MNVVYNVQGDDEIMGSASVPLSSLNLDGKNEVTDFQIKKQLAFQFSVFMFEATSIITGRIGHSTGHTRIDPAHFPNSSRRQETRTQQMAQCYQSRTPR